MLKYEPYTEISSIFRLDKHEVAAAVSYKQAYVYVSFKIIIPINTNKTLDVVRDFRVGVFIVKKLMKHVRR
jgi:hypothetical protein